MPVDLGRARELFLHAVGQLPPEQWDGYVAAACGSDAELAHQVGHLLQVHREAGSFLDLPAFAPQPGVETDDDVSREQAGTVIGPYKLLQQIGEGGMGTVYMAEQSHPVRRMVALKVIKAGMDSRQVIARFEAERQALAVMDHVNIARVLDAGTTDAGLPYFVMELVHGVPITKYCDDNRLTPRERLELFVPVCQAIQHAHQKGIIHRDVKPSNVMVTLYDGRPVPKVIDFGVAKATEQRLTERTLFTQYGTMVGTLEYMSPEQAEMSALGVDTRSDIFSLGVLLYELLTGGTPLSRKRVREAAYGEVLRMIREEEPPKPSTRLSDSGAALASISAQRQMEPAKLAKLVRGELDWIVMKCLEKDRSRRYETANAFAADVLCYLNDEAVQACPTSTSYRVRKFTRRHKAAVRVAAAFAGLLVLGVVVSTGQAVRATLAEQQANVDRTRANTAEDEAKANEAKARDEARKARQSESEARSVLEFFRDRVLAAARPQDLQGGLGINATIRAAVDAAEPQIGPAFQDQPLVEASIRSALGESYLYLGESALAIRQQERSRQLRSDHLGPDHLDTLTSMYHLASAYHAAGQLDRALPLYERVLEQRTAKLGPDHADTVMCISSLGTAYYADGQLEKAQPLYERALEKLTERLGPDHPDTLRSTSDLATAYYAGGKPEKALPHFERVVAKMTENERLGPNHPDTLLVMNNLAMASYAAGQFEKAIPLFKRVLEKMSERLGPNHPDTLDILNNLAGTYKEAGQPEKALPLLEKALEKRKEKLGPDHPDTLTSMNNLATAYRDAGRLGEAEPLYREAVTGARRKQSFANPVTQTYVRNLALCHDHMRQPAKSEPLWRELATYWKEKAGADSPQYAAELHPLGLCLLEQQKPAEAEPLLRMCLTIREAKLPNDWTTFNTRSLLGGSLLGQKKYAEAEPLLVGGYEGLKQREAKIPAASKIRLTEALERLVQLYEATGPKDRAAEWRKKLASPKGPPRP